MLGVQLFEKEANAFHIDQKQLNAQEITNPLRDGKSRIMKLLGSSDINHRIEFLTNLYNKAGEIINDHAIDLEIEQYRVSGEKKAEWISIQPIIFYFLILGGILSLAIFYVSSTN